MGYRGGLGDEVGVVFEEGGGEDRVFGEEGGEAGDAGGVFVGGGGGFEEEPDEFAAAGDGGPVDEFDYVGLGLSEGGEGVGERHSGVLGIVLRLRGWALRGSLLSVRERRVVLSAGSVRCAEGSITDCCGICG